MSRAIALRPDFSAAELRRLARRGKDAAQARRLLALAAIYDGGMSTAEQNQASVAEQNQATDGMAASALPAPRSGGR
jgi:hypothetical protein